MPRKILILPIAILLILFYLLFYLLGQSKYLAVQTEIKSAKTEKQITRVPSSTITPSSPTPKPTIRVTVSLTPTPTIVPPTPNPDISKYLLDQVNVYRVSQGLSTAQSEPNACGFATIRAAQIKSDFSHNGFQPVPYPNYSKVVENIAMNSDYKKVVESWINSPGHAENMRADTPFICVIQNGNYFALEGWKP